MQSTFLLSYLIYMMFQGIYTLFLFAWDSSSKYVILFNDFLLARGIGNRPVTMITQSFYVSHIETKK